MSWKKHFKPVNSVLPIQHNSNTSQVATNKYSSWLPEMYQGPKDRLQRYGVYEAMNYDHEVNAALDTISDFCTDSDLKTNLPFTILYNDTPTPHEIIIIEKTLRQWCLLNDFNKRLWKLFRSTLMYGDQFFIRDPATFKLMWVNPNSIIEILVNEANGKSIESYKIKGLDLNFLAMNATPGSTTDKSTPGLFFTPPLGGILSSPASNYVSNGISGTKKTDNSEHLVDARHMVQLSLADGMGVEWPFGNSILDFIYKIFKQKELLEDSVIIYRVHRAPERRAFFIDTGTLPPNKAQQVLERTKYEVQQKRIPNRNGGGANVMDSAYNPMSILEDYFFAVSSEGRGSKVETLPGGENLGDIDDLRYFNNKMLRALGVPSSYLPTGPEDGGAGFNDGRVGTAFIQEFRFSKVCERYQKKIIKPLDEEFKLFLNHKGIVIDSSLFSINFSAPQSFSEYRRMELDAAHINTFSAIAEVPYISKRFALSRYLGWTEEEINKNEIMWQAEKNGLQSKNGKGYGSLRDIGITATGIENMAPEGGFESVDDNERDNSSDIEDNLDVDNLDVDNFGEE